jgi:uncharacterized protein (TIGR02996 family)
MTDAAFLDALTADPGDETTRLVYSDWLEENGDDRRAAFLRLQGPVEPAVLAQAVAGLDENWVFQAGRRWDVVLTLYPLARKILLIKTIRELRTLGLAAAKDLSERRQPVIVPGVPAPIAVEAAERLVQIGRKELPRGLNSLDDTRPVLVQIRPAPREHLEPLVRGVPYYPPFEAEHFLRVHAVQADQKMSILRWIAEIAPCDLHQAMEGLLGPLPLTIAHLNPDEEAELLGRFAGRAQVEVLHAPHGSPAGEWMDLVVPCLSRDQAAEVRPHLVRLRGSTYTTPTADRRVEYFLRRLPRFYAEELMVRLAPLGVVSMRRSEDQP